MAKLSLQAFIFKARVERFVLTESKFDVTEMLFVKLAMTVQLDILS